jgi:16S rRNA (adenine1518-N6/adenine1519-N6)-dimethyltransferase
MKLFAKKSLGQHFLISKSVLAEIISTANIQKGENILEIGPGTGILTQALLATGAQVIAVEKDDRAFDILNQAFFKEIQSGALKLIKGDVLESDASYLIPHTSYSIVANIPYYITGAILEKFLEHEPRPSRMVLLVQKEVAERIVAKPEGNKEQGKESILSISVKVFGEPKLVAKVPPGAFKPPPTVDSAILSITNISAKNFTENGVNIPKFFEILRAGFAHKRKFLKRNLEEVVPAEKISETWNALKLDEKIRAEDLKTEDWIRIAKMI